jgi:hypothetical protein
MEAVMKDPAEYINIPAPAPPPPDSQKGRIYEWLSSGRKMTGITGWKIAGTMKLATRISEMRRDGFHIDVQMVKVKNRFHENIMVAEYSMPSTEVQGQLF